LAWSAAIVIEIKSKFALSDNLVGENAQDYKEEDTAHVPEGSHIGGKKSPRGLLIRGDCKRGNEYKIKILAFWSFCS